MDYMELFLFMDITDAAEIGHTISIVVASPADIQLGTIPGTVVFNPGHFIGKTLITDGQGSRTSISDHIVINEVGTDSRPGYVSWIEIINPTGDDISIEGWKINASWSGSNHTLCTFSGTLKAGKITTCDAGNQLFQIGDNLKLVGNSNNEVDSVTPSSSCPTLSYGDTCARYRDGSDFPTTDWYVDSGSGTKGTLNDMPEFKDIFIPLIGTVVIVLFIRKRKLDKPRPVKSK